jgi:hypothetical protein
VEDFRLRAKYGFTVMHFQAPNGPVVKPLASADESLAGGGYFR